MPIIHDPMRVAPRTGTIYPAPLDKGFEGRLKRALTQPLRLTQFGVNLTTLLPGAQSSHRHWHKQEDEFIYILAGELVLMLMDGEHVLRSQMAVSFPAGVRNGHHLINRSAEPATYLEIGTRAKDDDITYPDVDLKVEKRAGTLRFFHKSGEPYR
jgi:uncharacterized cupin superfamily protein